VKNTVLVEGSERIENVGKMIRHDWMLLRERREKREGRILVFFPFFLGGEIQFF